jgi:hypothetical protein
MEHGAGDSAERTSENRLDELAGLNEVGGQIRNPLTGSMWPLFLTDSLLPLLAKKVYSLPFGRKTVE